MPYYIAAFYVNMYMDRSSSKENLNKLIASYKKKPVLYLVLSAILFGILFIFYNEYTFIYVSGYRVSRTGFIRQLLIDTYRMLIGFAGSTFFMILWDRITELCKDYKWPVLSAFGKNSLGVYILQGYYILIVMASYTNNMTGIRWYHIPAEVVIISAVSLITAWILGKIPIIRILVGKI